MQEIKKFIYIHVACLDGWNEIYDDVVSYVPKHERHNIVSVVTGDPGSHSLINPIQMHNFGVDYDEVIALQTMWNHARYIKEGHFYYMHLKGNSRKGNMRKYCDSWRRFMGHFMFRDMNLNTNLLSKYDCLGSMLLTNPLHYQGNFFVTKASHLRKLPYIEYRSENRYHESWITCVQGKYVNYLANYQLMNLYENEIRPENYRVHPWYMEQVKLPHGTTHIPVTAECEI
jgi:hypothetical protein